MSLTDRIRVIAARAQAAPITLLTRHVFDHNWVCRLGIVRRWPRVVCLVRGRLGVVATRSDVRSALCDDSTFAAGYTTRLPGPFVLGLEGDRHAQVRAELERAVRAGDAASIAGQTRERARAIVASASGSLDVGADLVHPIFDETVRDYLGIVGSDSATRWLWGRDIFEHIFLNFADAAAVRAASEAATAQLTELITDTIAAVRADPPDTVLGRLVRSGVLTDAEICVNLIGLAVGWWWHGARTALIAVDEILRRRDGASARAAAEAGEHALQRFLWETLRFRPVQIGVIRTCTRDTVLAAQQLRGGETVVIGTQSAMWDGIGKTFDADRPDDTYLIFGDGVHRCLGEQLMRAQLPAMLAPVLSQPGLRRDGRLRWDGPRPDGVAVRW